MFVLRDTSWPLWFMNLGSPVILIIFARGPAHLYFDVFS